MYVAYTNCLNITVVIVCACYSEEKQIVTAVTCFLYSSTHERYNKLWTIVSDDSLWKQNSGTTIWNMKNAQT